MQFFKKKAKVDLRVWGQEGHLDPDQTKALEEMRISVAEDFNPEVDDTYRLLQFLRARKFDAAKAATLFREMKQWRKAYGADDLLGVQIPNTDTIRKNSPNAHHKFDKLGRPIYIELLGYQDVKLIVQGYHVPMEDLVRHQVQYLERQREVMKEASARTGTRIGTVISILDLQGCSIKKNLTKTAREYAKQIAHIGQTYYPESLGKMFIVNAPSAFGAAWRFIKPFLDPRTVNKIEVIKGNPGSRLLEFIDADSLPASLGGTCNCPGGCIPVDIAALSAGEQVTLDDEDVEAELGGGGAADDDGPPGPNDEYEDSDVGSPVVK